MIKKPLNKFDNYREEDIAIIGMALRFPGARNPDEFWENLINGKESVTFYNNDELLRTEVDSSTFNNPNYVKASCIIRNIDMFDAKFFDISPRDAALIDPQNRLFLECAWEALEDSGYVPEMYNGIIGVYAGSFLSTYLIRNVIDLIHENMKKENEVYQLYQCISDFLTTYVSYKLNLTGPSVTVQTWCTSAIAAVHVACQALRNNECNIALAGGVHIRLPQEGYFYHEGGPDSPDGHTRSFDMDANGAVLGNGSGIVVLKKLKDAVKDRDYIYAVIKGSSIINDGSGGQKLSYYGLTIDGQIRAICKALTDAGVSAETIDYIEAHGVATELADRFELTALRKAFRKYTQKNDFCAIGSVKPNIGHLGNASGIASIIKTTLALENKLIPPTINFQKLNPKNDRKNSPFYINKELLEWKTNEIPHRAGINCFGIGGTNVHMILEEAPQRRNSGKSRPFKLMILSAKTSSALESISDNLSIYLKEKSDIDIADVAYSLNMGRKPFDFRRIVICENVNDAIKQMEKSDSKHVYSKYNNYNNRSVVFMFPGIGDQFVNMAVDLFKFEPAFRKQINLCSTIIKRKLGLDLNHLLYTSNKKSLKYFLPFENDIISGPALFSVEYALAVLLTHWGIVPQAMIGYSIGEYVAACLSGVMTLEDALSVIITQSGLFKKIPHGKMLAVALAEEEVKPFLDDKISLAAVNGPSTCIVSGPVDEVNKLQKRMQIKNIDCLLINSLYAYHSAMVEPIINDVVTMVKKINMNAPQIPFISSVTGTWITEKEIQDPNYWAMKLRRTVQFEKGLQLLLSNEEQVLLEVGPRQTLSLLANNHKNRSDKQVVLSVLPRLKGRYSELEYLLTIIGKLWLNGVNINWYEFYKQEKRNRLPLPTYPFERKSYWFHAPKHKNNQDDQESLNKKQDIADWFYTPVWRQAVKPVLFGQKLKIDKKHCWLFLLDKSGVGVKIGEELLKLDQDVIFVRTSDSFSRDNHDYFINPHKREDYKILFEKLNEKNKVPDKIVHLWSITDESERNTESNFDNSLCLLGYQSLIYIAQELGGLEKKGDFHIFLISNDLHKVTGEERLYSEKATIYGPIKVIPKEYQNITCSTIDIDFTGNNKSAENSINNILYELTSEFSKLNIAFRKGNRWEQTFSPVRLLQNDLPSKRLKEKGVYLITGGLGGIGFILAEYLAKTLKAKLILTGRSGFPERDNWDNYLTNQGFNNITSQKILKVKEWEEKYNAEVLILQADVADKSQMKKVIQKSIGCFGNINGIIHLAGIQGGGMIQFKKPENFTEVFAPKVYGTKIIHSLIKNKNLDFVVLGSSTASVIGFYGMVDYCAANAYMDMFCHEYNANNNTYFVSINWDMWSEVGMGINSELPDDIKKLREENKKYGIMSDEGVDIFNRILSSNLPQVIVSTRDLLKIESLKLFGKLHEVDTNSWVSIEQSRPDMSTEFIAPATDIQKEIADMWSKLFGVEQIGINDNFFDLGGHSLIATMLLNKLRLIYNNVEVSHGDLFDNPTVSQLAEFIEDSMNIEKADLIENKDDAHNIKKKIIEALPQDRHELIENYLKRKIAEAFNIDVNRLPADGDLKDFELEKISGQLYLDLKNDLEIPIYDFEIARIKSVKDLVFRILDELDQEKVRPEIQKQSELTEIKSENQNIQNNLKIIKKNKSMIFLHSAPRSGSTLLRLMLAGHSSLFCPPEMRLLAYQTMDEWEKSIPRHNKIHGGVFRSLKELITFDHDKTLNLLENLIKKKTPIQEVYGLIQEKLGDKILVDKCPDNATAIEKLERAEYIFEDAHYIYLVRHPYSVIDSIVRNRLYSIRNIKITDPYIFAEEDWFIRNQNLLNFFKNIDKNRHYLVRFEDLIQHPKRSREGVCDFLNIPFEEAILNPYSGKRMIDGDGDPNIFNHDSIDTSLGEVWKNIKLPNKLSKSTKMMALQFNYQLPYEDLSENEENDFFDKGDKGLQQDITQRELNKVDNLSDEEIDDLLKILQENHDIKKS
jgi:acyl transferase domain-containing protein